MPDYLKSALDIGRSHIDRDASKAARNPSEAQTKAGNYVKGHVRIHGLDISIENPRGSQRHGVSRDGKRWSVTLPAHYGYVKGSVGSDGDHVDCYIGPDPHSDRVYVVDQIDAKTGKYDEHKCLIGFKSHDAATDAYKRAFSDGKGKDRIGAVTELSIEKFKDWLRSDDTKKPLSFGRNNFASGGKVDMPLIKSGSRDAISENIKTEMGEGGKNRSQAVAIALDVARRAKKRAKGERVGYAGGGNTVADDSRDYVENGLGRAAEMGKLRRQVQAKALSGIDPEEKDIAALEAYKPEILKRQLGMMPYAFAGPAAGAILSRPAAAGAAALLGAFAPSAMGEGNEIPQDAKDDMARFLADWQKVNPRGTSNRAAIEDAARRAYQDSDIGRRMNDPHFNYSAAAKARNERAFMDDYFARNPASTDEPIEAYSKRGMAAWNDRRRLALEDTASQRADAAYKKLMADRPWNETPFEDTWWGRNVNPTETPLVVGGASGLGLGLKDAYSQHSAAARWEDALDKAAAATTPTASLAAKSRIGAAQAGAGKGYGYGVPIALGAIEGLGSTALPVIWNRGLADANPERKAIEAALAELPAGHPDRYRWEPRLNDPKAPGYAPEINPAKSRADAVTWDDIGANALQRAGLGAAAATFGRLPGTIMSPSKGRLGELEARTAEAAMTPAQVADEAKRMLGIRGVEDAYGEAVADSKMRALKTARDLSESRQIGSTAPALTARTGQLQREADSLEAGAGTGLKDSPVAEPEVGPAMYPGRRSVSVLPEPVVGPSPVTTPRAIYRGLPEGPSPGIEAETSPLALEAPPAVIKPEGVHHIHFQPRDETGRVAGPPEYPKRITREKGTIVAPASKANAKGNRTINQDAKADPVVTEDVDAGPTLNGKKVPKKPDYVIPDDDPIGKGRKSGGAVEKAMEVARRYAAGGSVHVGPVVGSTGGRDDALPINVPSGAFVLPADTVSGIPGAGGNTLAGMKILEKQFGRPMASGGQAVPIKISDGEFVISPEQVRKIGNGDMDAGHRALDAFVRKVRAHHVSTLKSLPGPAK